MNHLLRLSFLPLVLLAACKNIHQDTDWSTNCERYYSYDSREFSQCEKRNESNRKPGTVNLDPNDVNRTAEQEIGKGTKGIQ
jgi:hypothetical protein